MNVLAGLSPAAVKPAQMTLAGLVLDSPVSWCVVGDCLIWDGLAGMTSSVPGRGE